MDFTSVFESERIKFIKYTDKLVQEYLDMVNDIEVQKYIIKTSHYEKENCLLLMTDTYKCVKEEKQVLLSELLKEEKNFINEEFATNYMAYIITSRIDQYKSCQELILLYMITIFKQLKPFFNVQTIKRILRNALKITNNQKDEDFACQCVD